MSRHKVIEHIDDLITMNGEHSRHSSELLSIIREQVVKLTDELDGAYDQGVTDLWEVMDAILADLYGGCGLSMKKNETIFGYRHISEILNNLTPFDIIKLYKVYKESQTFKRGNIVRYTMGSGIIRESVYLGEEQDAYWVMGPADVCPQRLPKDKFVLEKTDGYVDFYTYLRDREA